MKSKLPTTAPTFPAATVRWMVPCDLTALPTKIADTFAAYRNERNVFPYVLEGPWNGICTPILAWAFVRALTEGRGYDLEHVRGVNVDAVDEIVRRLRERYAEMKKPLDVLA